MQVSTKLFNKQSVENFSDLTAQIQKKQEQVATGKHLTEPSDDPVKAGRVMVVKEQKAKQAHPSLTHVSQNVKAITPFAQ